MTTLAQHLVITIAEHDIQINSYKFVSSSLEHDLKVEWQKRIDEFLEDRTRPSPYLLNEKDKLISDTRLQVLMSNMRRGPEQGKNPAGAEER